jgi:hypothetical protein
MSLKPTASMPKTERDWHRFTLETHDLRLMSGAGDPEGVVTANRGTIYMRTDGSTSTTLYVKTANDGSANGWTAK